MGSGLPVGQDARGYEMPRTRRPPVEHPTNAQRNCLDAERRSPFHRRGRRQPGRPVSARARCADGADRHRQGGALHVVRRARLDRAVRRSATLAAALRSDHLRHCQRGFADRATFAPGRQRLGRAGGHPGGAGRAGAVPAGRRRQCRARKARLFARFPHTAIEHQRARLGLLWSTRKSAHSGFAHGRNRPG